MRDRHFIVAIGHLNIQGPVAQVVVVVRRLGSYHSVLLFALRLTLIQPPAGILAAHQDDANDPKGMCTTCVSARSNPPCLDNTAHLPSWSIVIPGALPRCSQILHNPKAPRPRHPLAAMYVSGSKAKYQYQ